MRNHRNDAVIDDNTPHTHSLLSRVRGAVAGLMGREIPGPQRPGSDAGLRAPTPTQFFRLS